MTQSEHVDHTSGLQLQSAVTKDGRLEIKLATVETPAPGPGDVVVRIEASPINPSDLGLLFGPADMAAAEQTGSDESPILSAPIPEKFMGMVAARLDQAMPVGNEGTGIVIAAVDIRTLPKLEGTVHVNIALISKFMPNYFFNPGEFPELDQQSQAANDDFLFDQGGAGGLGQISFHDYRETLKKFDTVPNVKCFSEQTEAFRELLTSDPPGPDQMKDVDFLLAGGNIFALVVYAQLILESAPLNDIGEDLLGQIFDFMVRDMSGHALTLSLQESTTEKQTAQCQKMLRKPVADSERYARVWQQEVQPLDGAYEMKP